MTSDGWERRLTAALRDDALAAARQSVASVVGDRRTRDLVLDRLADAAAGGSDVALELLAEVVDQHGLARAGVRRVLVGEDETDEVTQDVLISMVTSISSYSSAKGKFSTWLFQIARNRAVDHLRRRRSTEQMPPEMGPAARISSLIATRLSVQEKVDLLPPHFRDALVLRDVRRLTYDEVAQRLELNVNTTKSHVARGRAMLARLLDETD